MAFLVVVAVQLSMHTASWGDSRVTFSETTSHPCNKHSNVQSEVDFSGWICGGEADKLTGQGWGWGTLAKTLKDSCYSWTNSPHSLATRF